MPSRCQPLRWLLCLCFPTDLLRSCREEFVWGSGGQEEQRFQVHNGCSKLSSTLVLSGIPRGPSKYSPSKYSKNQLPASVRTTGDLGVAGLFEAPINIYFWPRKFAQVSAPKQVGGMLSTMSPIFSARVLPGREATANAIRNDSALTRGSLLQLMEQAAIIKAHFLILFILPLKLKPNQANPQHYLLLNVRKPRPATGQFSGLCGAGLEV